MLHKDKDIREDDDKEAFTLLLDKKDSIFVSKRRRTIKKHNPSETWFYVGFIGQVGYTVALPMVVGVLIGEYIDKRLGIYPKATSIGLFIGIIVSIIGFISLIRELLGKQQK